MPAANLRELIAYAKANPGKLSYGTPGIATGNHLVGESFKQQAGGLDIVHVPYRGIAQATNDLVSGQISLVIGVMSVQLQQLSQAGKIRLLAVTTEKRLSGAPDIPTAVESGMPDLRYEGWFGIFAPKLTDDAIIDRIAQTNAPRHGRSGASGELPCPGHGAGQRFKSGQIPAHYRCDNGKPGARDQIDWIEQVMSSRAGR